jgi:hypothetical protein
VSRRARRRPDPAAVLELRARFTTNEWRLYQQGKCCWQTGYGLPGITYCNRRSKPGHPFGYCPKHARELAEQ